MAAKIPDMKFDKEQTPWARWAQDEITNLKQKLAAKDRADSNANQATTATIAAMPVPAGYVTSTSGFSLNPNGLYLEQSAIVVPQNKTTVVFVAVGQSVLEGTVSTQAAYAQILYGLTGAAAPYESISVDATLSPNGAKTVNSINITITGRLTGLTAGQTFFVALNAFADDVTKFPSDVNNSASLGVTATFY